MRSSLASAVLMAILAFGSFPLLNASSVPAAVAETRNSIRVAVEPRIELVAIVQYLSKYRHPQAPLITNYDSAYRQKVDAWFSRLKDHAAVREFERMAEDGYSFNAPPLSMLYLDDNFQPRRDLVTDEFLVRRSGGAAQVQKFAHLLRAFSRESNFPNFFDQHREFYATLISAVRDALDHNYVAELEALYGTRNASYNLLLVPLYGPVGYGPILHTTKGENHVYSIIGPRSVQGGRQSFVDEGYFQYMQRHEFSHSFVNPITSRFPADVQRTSGLMNLMGDAVRRDVCGEWEECLNENIVRAATTFLAFRDSPEAGQKALARETGRGAALVPEILEALRSYSTARDQYPTLVSYYPMILDRLARLSTTKPTQAR